MYGQYVEFALNCAAAVGAGGDRRALQSVVEACVRACGDVASCESGCVRESGDAGWSCRSCRDGLLGIIGATYGGRVLSSVGDGGSGCAEDGRGTAVGAECSGSGSLRAEVGDGLACAPELCDERTKLKAPLSADKERGKNYGKNKKKREAAKSRRDESRTCGARGSFVPEWRRGAQPLVDGSGGCVSDESVAGSGGSVTGSVRTVDTRTGVEIAAAQTLAARRVAENERAEAEAKVAKRLAEHRLVALQDKDRTVAVQRLAAARYEQRINEAKAKSQASYKKCDESMKSLGSTGSAGEFALKQMVKEARDNAKTLKYVQEQADLFYQYATPEVRRMVAEMPEPEMEDEFEVFGDCPSDYNDEQREAYYDDLNRRNAEHGLVGTGPPPPRREPTPEELLRIEEEIRALSMR